MRRHQLQRKQRLRRQVATQRAATLTTRPPQPSHSPLGTKGLSSNLVGTNWNIILFWNVPEGQGLVSIGQRSGSEVNTSWQVEEGLLCRQGKGDCLRVRDRVGSEQPHRDLEVLSDMWSDFDECLEYCIFATRGHGNAGEEGGAGALPITTEGAEGRHRPQASRGDSPTHKLTHPLEDSMARGRQS